MGETGPIAPPEDPRPFSLEVQEVEPEKRPDGRVAPPWVRERQARDMALRRARGATGLNGPREAAAPWDREVALQECRDDARFFRERALTRWGINPDAADAEQQRKDELARRLELVGQGYTFIEGEPMLLKDWFAKQRLAREIEEEARRVAREGVPVHDETIPF